MGCRERTVEAEAREEWWLMMGTGVDVGMKERHRERTTSRRAMLVESSKVWMLMAWSTANLSERKEYGRQHQRARSSRSIVSVQHCIQSTVTLHQPSAAALNTDKMRIDFLLQAAGKQRQCDSEVWVAAVVLVSYSGLVSCQSHLICGGRFGLLERSSQLPAAVRENVETRMLSCPAFTSAPRCAPHCCVLRLERADHSPWRLALCLRAAIFGRL